MLPTVYARRKSTAARVIRGGKYNMTKIELCHVATVIRKGEAADCLLDIIARENPILDRILNYYRRKYKADIDEKVGYWGQSGN